MAAGYSRHDGTGSHWAIKHDADIDVRATVALIVCMAFFFWGEKHLSYPASAAKPDAASGCQQAGGQSSCLRLNSARADSTKVRFRVVVRLQELIKVSPRIEAVS